MNIRLKIGMILAVSVPIILGIGMIVKGQIFVTMAVTISLICLLLGLTYNEKESKMEATQ